MAMYPYRGRPAYRPPGIAPVPTPFFARARLSDQLYDPRLGLLTAHLFPEPPLPEEGLLSPKAMALDPYAADWPPVDPDKGLLWLAGSPLREEQQPSLDMRTAAATEDGDGENRTPTWRQHMPLPMPPYLQGRYKEDWFPFNRAVRQTGMTATEVDAARTTFGFEGGMQPDPRAGGDEDPGVGGVTGSWLVDVGDRDKWAGEEHDPNALSLQQIADAYKVHIDDDLNNVGGGAALTRILDHKTALEVFDTLFKHGRHGGAEVIQKGVNQVIMGLDEKERERHALQPIPFTDPDTKRVVGPLTLDLMRRLIDAGYAKQLRGAIADQRALDQPPRGNLQARYDFYR